MFESDMDFGHTPKEIAKQPLLWKETYAIVVSERKEISAFLTRALQFDNLQILLVGAGTSAYIGQILEKYYRKKLRRHTEAVASTDFISHSKDYMGDADRPTLIVSFARSGDSPESLAVIDLAKQHYKCLFHLIVTCNPNGNLAKNAVTEDEYILLMPEAANDKGLAMTGSFSSMLLAATLLADLDCLESNKSYVCRLSQYAETILERYHDSLRSVAALDFDRVVFLGSGPLNGIARESQLKVQELTDGQVICKFDSFLGLRHGPKVVINKKTVVVYLFSSNDFVNKYEYDLVRSINAQNEKLYEIGIGETIKSKNEISLDLAIEVSTTNVIPEEYFAICAILPAQILGFYKSLQIGLSPDSPSVNKSINRVVQGVVIYKSVDL